MTLTVVVLKDNFRAVRNSITGPILLSAAAAGGHVIEGAAKINVSDQPGGLHVRSGALRASIHVSESKQTETYAEVAVGPTVVYARIHEYGGVITTANAIIHIPARPYMRPAVDENEARIDLAVNTRIKNSIDRAVS